MPSCKIPHIYIFLMQELKIRLSDISIAAFTSLKKFLKRFLFFYFLLKSQKINLHNIYIYIYEIPARKREKKKN